MTRAEFIRAYAERSGLDAKWAILGYIDVGDRDLLVAMPCACGDETCEGWSMLSPSSISSHLSMYAPEPLRSAYVEAIGQTAKNMIF